jgi:hypothetical protein
LKLFAQHFNDVQRPLAVERGRQIVFSDFSLGLPLVLFLRDVAELESGIDRNFHFVETTPAFETQPRYRPPLHPEGTGAGSLDVHGQLDRAGHTIQIVLRIERGALKCALDMLTLAVQLAEIEEHI